MNRRNWLKTIGALAAGMVTAPLAAKEWLLRGNGNRWNNLRKKDDKYWYVDSTRGRYGNDGTAEFPLLTLDAAISRAKSGDMITVFPHHTEDTTGFVFDKPLSVIGMSANGKRPLFHHRGDGPCLDIRVDGCRIKGLSFIISNHLEKIHEPT